MASQSFVPAKEEQEQKYDKLHLRDNKDIKSMLAKEGQLNEQVVYSEKIVKVSSKGQMQKRILLITTNAICNLAPKSYKISKRRIELKNVGMITLSMAGPELVIHVPNEYDFHLASTHKKDIAEIVTELFLLNTKCELLVVESELKHLKSLVLTKKLAQYEQQNDKHAVLRNQKLVTGYGGEDETENDNDDHINSDDNIHHNHKSEDEISSNVNSDNKNDNSNDNNNSNNNDNSNNNIKSNKKNDNVDADDKERMKHLLEI